MESINIQGNYEVQNAFNSAINRIGSNTTILCFSSVKIAGKDILDTDIKSALARCPSLTSLSIKNCPRIMLKEVNLTNKLIFTELSIEDSPITDAAIKELKLQNCNSLSMISFIKCEQISLNKVELPWAKLAYLNIPSTNVSWETVEAIQSKNPKLLAWVSWNTTEKGVVNSRHLATCRKNAHNSYNEVIALSTQRTLPTAQTLTPNEFSQILKSLPPTPVK